MFKTSFLFFILDKKQSFFLKLHILLLLTLSINSCKKSVKEEIVKSNTQYSNRVIESIKKQSQNNILVCAHRGFHLYAPENSTKSIKDAIEASINIVEIDIRTTKDSVLILMHDETIERTTTGKGKVSDYTYRELLAFNLKINDSITSHKIPKLEDILILSKNRLILNLDLKDVIPLMLYELLKKNQMQHRVFSFIWDKKLMGEMIKMDSLYAVLPLSRNQAEMETNLKRYHSTLQHFDNTSYTSEGMDWALENGVQVFINSLWDIDESFDKGNNTLIDSLIALKPSIIQTDYPKKLLKYMKDKGLSK